MVHHRPAKGRWRRPMVMWDITTTLALVYTAFLTPYEVTLDPPKTWAAAVVDPPSNQSRHRPHVRAHGPSRRAPIFFFTRMLFSSPSASYAFSAVCSLHHSFVSDIFLQFVLITQVHSRASGVKWIEDPAQIVRLYVRGWFLLDFASTLPSLCDIVPLFLNQAGGGSGGGKGDNITVGGAAADNSNEMIGRLKALRVIRCTRLAKLTRLLRASRMLKRWETRVSINYAVLGLCRSLVYYLMLAHCRRAVP